jgi:hypothetical protein
VSYRPYPNRDRALRHLRYSQATYLYGRCPQRVALGFSGIEEALLTTARRVQKTLRTSRDRSQYKAIS